ncbi:MULTISPECIES: CHAD domain-containing protein [Trichocoleus]|uniref:CHAD domain-containing protein n=1 Tax=Trichocoleus desertorum GB2-A4 TaxID=2933944 RepID=A0ABV0J398_9CYAN|nr:CHAD domain-containing protein [Trichocoleus sp. FACHB-46]MBD1861600.1 CHAD domain-containing protein [Trichocoleus sp. FACHB-46]
MKIQTPVRAATLGEYAHQAIQQHFKKSVKPEAAVLQDSEPEHLHQMRVGMRRLRTALQVFGPALDLPKAANIPQISKIAKKLGAVRDLDVLQPELKNRYYPSLKKAEQKELDAVFRKLQKQRSHHFAELEKTLHRGHYQKFKKAFSRWVKHPEYQAIAEQPILKVLPDLLLPLISQLLLHPGWLVGANLAQNQSSSKLDTKVIQALLADQETQLHDLRKQLKRVRYQTEFFTDFYDPAYAAQVEDFKNIQEVLGQIQDYSVLSEFLSAELESDLATALPTLDEQIQQRKLQLWQSWQPIQQRYLAPEFRNTLRLQVMCPVVSDLSSTSEVVVTVGTNGRG